LPSTILGEKKMDKWQKFLEAIDIRSGAALNLFTVQVMAMCWVVIFKYRGILEIPQSIITVYGMVLGGVTLNGISKVVKGNQ
jgi:hypothetical protein